MAQRPQARHPLLSRLLVPLCASVLLAGCGGGGGSDPSPLGAVTPDARPPESQPSTDQPPPSASTGCVTLHDGTCASVPDFDARAAQLARGYADHPAFQVQWGLGSIGADRAYAHVNLLEGEDAAPGSGVTIGFIDDGIDAAHPAFAGKTVTEVLIGDAVDQTGADGFSHGTAVASIAAGIRDRALREAGGPHGVAWGADIAMFAIPLGEGDGTYEPISLESLAEADAERVRSFSRALSWRDGARRVEVLNLSFGHQGLIDGYGEADLRAHLSQAIAAMAQAGVADKAILVWAAGNSHGNTCAPSIPTARPARSTRSRRRSWRVCPRASPSSGDTRSPWWRSNRAARPSPPSPTAAASRRTSASPRPERTSASPISGLPKARSCGPSAPAAGRPSRRRWWPAGSRS